jgi:hypothetical protein
MNAREVSELVNGRPIGAGKWIACCPAHDDRSPSLSIAEGRDGRALLFCHAGCEIEAIARAIGVEVRALFIDDARASWHLPKTRRKSTTDELRAALQREAELYRGRRSIVGELFAHELNAIRRAVGMKLGVVLDDLPRSLHEGGYGGRERDPAWPAIFEWALTIASVEILGFPVAFDETLPPPRTVLLAAEERAAAAMRSLELDERGSRGQTV